MKARRAVPTVSLHIETLVLDGFAPGDRYRIGAAMQRELERLVSMHGLAPFTARFALVSISKLLPDTTLAVAQVAADADVATATLTVKSTTARDSADNASMTRFFRSFMD